MRTQAQTGSDGPRPPGASTDGFELRRSRSRACAARWCCSGWWTEDCPYCAATLPALEQARGRDAANGLVVIGVFHPKPPRPVSDRHVLAVANRLGFTGPIAVDERWSTLERYWLDGHPERSWTSISFLIDRQGIVRWVQGGGEYHPGNDPRHAECAIRYRDLEQAIAAALAAKGARR